MTLITFEDGKPLFRAGKVATEQSCCCDTQPPPPPPDACCCVGTSAITIDPVTNEENDETCLEITELGPEEECDGEIIAKPDPAESCDGAFAVIEWCGLSVTLNCEGENQFEDGRFSNDPVLCSVDGADITRQVITSGFGANVAGYGNFSDCSFGCGSQCNRCRIRFGFAVYETPTIGSELTRYYYVTQRSGCDESPIIENIFDNGGYCCPEEPEVTITFAP